ncbi:hypothetical protein SAV14893_064980 [Streptomyces avermitilis]|uniref:Uncharacterized protein n=1 Tax=Streptomyces avermitilis TaxID=33903 RepID=A0A4D4MKL6_STRAX|nr:hypothetical protein SAVMC3_77640 [Streptomyces avermitilis]GDY67105.1 hypothetical protein SAV14893_064980 [Streptomyces avermitilis]GDY72621.1 hypothetical protein SAV31267_021060 [Streptomyces avermitilis]GDY81748.1 hypothetical protein SAVCW2_09470 [Streptomyces avermitilis]
MPTAPGAFVIGDLPERPQRRVPHGRLSDAQPPGSSSTGSRGLGQEGAKGRTVSRAVNPAGADSSCRTISTPESHPAHPLPRAGAGHGHLARVPAAAAPDGSHRAAPAHATGSEQAECLARPDPEVDAVHRGHVAAPLAKPPWNRTLRADRAYLLMSIERWTRVRVRHNDHARRPNSQVTESA